MHELLSAHFLCVDCKHLVGDLLQHKSKLASAIIKCEGLIHLHNVLKLNIARRVQNLSDLANQMVKRRKVTGHAHATLAVQLLSISTMLSSSPRGFKGSDHAKLRTRNPDFGYDNECQTNKMNVRSIKRKLCTQL